MKESAKNVCLNISKRASKGMWYSKDEKTLEEIKRDLIYFDNENVKRKERAYSVIREGDVSTTRKWDISQDYRLKKTISEKTKT